MPQHFPTTHATAILEATRSPHADALAAVAARIIERYAQPLEAYAQGSTLREIGEPRDLVRGVTARLRTRVRELLDEEGRFGEDGVDEIIQLLS